MYKLKKSYFAALAIMLVFVLNTVGCENKETEQVNTTGTTAQTTTVEEKTSLDPAELIWYYPGSYPQKDQVDVFAKANELITERINANVKFMTVAWGEYEEKMKVIMASHEPYDLCFTSNWTNNYAMAVSKGAYLPLDDLLQKYAPKLYTSMPVEFWDAAKIKGKIYAVINQQIFTCASNFSINKEYAEKLGFNIDSVKKLEDLEPFLQAVKEKMPDIIPVYGRWEPLSADYFGFDLLGGTKIPGVISLKDDSLKVFNQFESDAFKYFIDLMQKWQNNGYIHGQELISIKDVTPLVKQQKFAVSWGGAYSPGVEISINATNGFESIVRPLCEGYVTTGSVTGTMHSVNRNSENPERAMMLMELMNTDVPLYNLISFGREGKDYAKLADGTIEPIKDAGYNPGTPWLHASNFNAYVLKGQPLDIWEQTKAINQNSKASPALGFAFIPEPVKNEIAQCSSVVEEYLKGFEYGLLNIEKDYPQFIEKLNKAGAKAIIDEMQKQINEWKATR